MSSWKRIPFENNGFNKTYYNLFEEKEKLPNFWNKKGVAVKKWRSRAWSIDPKVTKLSIIKTEAPNMENIDVADPFLDASSKLLENYPQLFEAIADMEHFGQQ